MNIFKVNSREAIDNYRATSIEKGAESLLAHINISIQSSRGDRVVQDLVIQRHIQPGAAELTAEMLEAKGYKVTIHRSWWRRFLNVGFSYLVVELPHE